eukprot:CAMPEP_0206217650 /NCGR_PEP_ID=MMETSP0047_2-20121206/3386_1 /ASSEMBLY_ACC=CAM_ASM_000192 /TAXON_ID=195065 /ORGANISM="Chroomonas mesostigmatica_cf, Strain CCMP1168" /LENGTH=491 /DNA_ID=CAMNT_0053640115 /DNA_START=218 /DNA_END=1690 /DNA_ORIENTATION=+
MAGAVAAYINIKKNRSLDSDASDLEAGSKNQSFVTEEDRAAVRRGLSTRGFKFHQDSAKNLDQESYSAGVIGRWYRRRAMHKGPFLSKELLAQRLDLEDMIFTGMARLVLFCLMFLLLYIGSSTGVSAGEKLQINTLITSTLELDEWRAVATLEELRDALPRISARIKDFSASSSERFQNHQKVQLIGRERYFAAPTLEPGLFLPVMRGEFTMTAWVQPEPSHSTTRSLIRKYTRANSGLDCWGWYHPNVFKFGAHDFHSLEMATDWQEVVTLPLGGLRRLIKESLSHQAIVVANRTITFYYDGKKKGTVPLPRDLTDCTGKIEIGGEDLSLSAFNFYPNALEDHQILEIYERGQPLSELATGSFLRPRNEDAFRELDEKIDRGVYRVGKDLKTLQTEGRASTMIEEAIRESETVDADPINPEDSSPAAYLLGAHPPSSIGDQRELDHWIAAGSPTGNASLTHTRSSDASGTHFSLLELPTYANGEPLGTL